MNEIRLVLHGNIRSKKNSKQLKMCGTRRRLVPSDAYTRWERDVRWQFRQLMPDAKLPLIPAWPCAVTRCHVFYRGPEPDLHGCQESIADALQGFLWGDDGQIVAWDGVRKYHDKDNPRIELTVQSGLVLAHPPR